MADEDQQDSVEIDDDTAEKLLADPDPTPEKSAMDDRDWKAEAEKWRRLSRQNEDAAKRQASKLKQYEDANKTDAERREERAAAAEARASKAESQLRRREIAEERAPAHATPAQIRTIAKRLVGESDDDLAADADDLFAQLIPASPAPKTPARPKENLRGGATPEEEPEEMDGRKLAAKIPRSSLI